MSDQPNQPNPGQTRELNLKTMAEQFATGLQRHFDMLAFNLASRESVTEETYARRVREPRMMPAAGLHLNFEQMQAYANDLMLRQLLSDTLNLAVHCLNNVHLFVTLVKTQTEQGSLSPEAQQEAQKAQQEFVRMPLDQKFNKLEERFHLMSDLEDSLVSLGFALQALAQQQGIVREPQLDENGTLTIELQTAKSGVDGGDLWKNPTDLEATEKVFREGQPITFSDVDLQNILLTVGVFGRNLFSSVSRYVQELRENNR
jgi:hypothetical protein